MDELGCRSRIKVLRKLGRVKGTGAYALRFIAEDVRNEMHALQTSNKAFHNLLPVNRAVIKGEDSVKRYDPASPPCLDIPWLQMDLKCP